MNYILIILEIILLFTSILLTVKKIGKNGLYYLIIIFLILSSLMSLKQIEIFGLEICSGFILSIGVFICTNILIQQHGIVELKKIITTNILTLMLFYGMLLLSCIFQGSDINFYANATYDYIFLSNINLYIASIISMTVSLYIDGYIYYFIKRIKNKIWISNILSMIISQFINVIILILIAYLFKLHILELIILLIVSYLVRIIVGSISTIVIYLSMKIKS